MTASYIASMQQSWHILIVDDNPDDCAIIRQQLLRKAERRYTFAEAATGHAGIALLRDTERPWPTCVVLDFNLPDMDAPTFLAALAEESTLTPYPTVVITGGADRENGRKVLRAGAQDFLGKDWLTADSLTRAIENAVERHSLLRELSVKSEVLLQHERELRENDRKKDEFLATLAHELRNPIAPISNGLTILRIGNDESTEPVRLMMERQLDHLIRLVDDLLDISRINSGKIELHMERVLVSAIIDHAIETTRSLFVAANHQLEVVNHEASLAVDGDLMRLSQVLSNLLNNSVKYTSRGGRIKVATTTEGAEVVIRVSDNGAGIAASMLPKVFDLFVQIDGTVDRALGGLGVGLTLVKRFVEMHNGSVSAESAGLGLGSTFTIRLPQSVMGETIEAVQQPWSTGHSGPARRVLVVDDSADGADSLASILQLCGHETRTASSGEDALRVALEFAPEVAFLDIGLPGMNGYDLARMLRKNADGVQLLLVAVSGWGSDADKRKSREAGFDLHLTKPADARRVLALVGSVA